MMNTLIEQWQLVLLIFLAEVLAIVAWTVFWSSYLRQALGVVLRRRARMTSTWFRHEGEDAIHMPYREMAVRHLEQKLRVTRAHLFVVSAAAFVGMWAARYTGEQTACTVIAGPATVAVPAAQHDSATVLGAAHPTTEPLPDTRRGSMELPDGCFVTWRVDRAVCLVSRGNEYSAADESCSEMVVARLHGFLHPVATGSSDGGLQWRR